jgi:1-acyl-sn-glycerol-3-phosphate acyltransferase
VIRDARHWLWTPLVHRYVKWRLARSFRALWLDGSALPRTDEPLILYANHTNFWDGFIVHSLVWKAARDGYVVMEEQNLARYRFLTRLGAISVRRGDRSSSLETLRYCASVLKRPRASLLVFPQGQIVSAAEPLELERGLSVLARMAKVRLVPLALRYAFFEHEYPDVLVAAGEPHELVSLEDCRARLASSLARLSELREPFALQQLIGGRRSVAEPSLPPHPVPLPYEGRGSLESS